MWSLFSRKTKAQRASEETFIATGATATGTTGTSTMTTTTTTTTQAQSPGVEEGRATAFFKSRMLPQIGKRRAIFFLVLVFVALSVLLVLELLSMGSIDDMVAEVQSMVGLAPAEVLDPMAGVVPPEAGANLVVTEDEAEDEMETEEGSEAEEDGEEGEEGEEVAEQETEEIPQPATSSPEIPLVAGPESNDKVWEALANVATWKHEPNGFPSRTLIQYLVHRKLWVKLAAFEFALVGNVLPPGQLERLAADIRARHEPSQIRRFLQRARFKDYALYVKLRGLLKV